MSVVWDCKIPAGLRFKVTKTTKGRLGLIIGEHKFRRFGVHKDGTQIFRCSIKQCSSRVALDPPLRKLLQISSIHNHPVQKCSGSDEAQPDDAANPRKVLDCGAGLNSGPRKSVCINVEDRMLRAQEADNKMSNLVEAVQGFREGSTYYSVGDGFYYSVNRTKGTRKFLKCFRHGRYHCMARASFEVSQRVLSVTTKHNHAPEPWVDELLKERRAVKNNAARDFQITQNCSVGSPSICGLKVLDACRTMESSVEHFMEPHMEQRMDHFIENNSNNHVDHFDQAVEQNVQGGLPRCEVTMNNQGGDKLHFNGYSYSKKAISANAIRWTCATPTRSVIRCKGAITTDRERPYCNPRSLALHNHPPEDPEASIMRDIARAKRRLYRRKVYQHPFQFYPWMYPLQQLHGQSEDRERSDGPAFSAGSLEAALGISGAPRTDPLGAGPSGFLDDAVKVKMEPEWVDAGALEPNCELDGQFDDTHDFNSEYQEDDIEGQRDEQNFSPVYGGHAQQLQQPTMVPDSRDPVKLHVPGKPNLTITVAPSRSRSAASTAPAHCPPLNLLNRKRGRPRGSAFGSYNENEDRVTTILTKSIIASKKLEKMERTGTASTYQSPVAAAMSSPVPGHVKPRSKDPEAVRAAQIVNNAQNKTGSREELEKVCLKLRQEVLALEVQNLKAEREKLAAYRRNIAVRREIMKLHLELESGIPSECASSGRGLNTVNVSVASSGSTNHCEKSESISTEQSKEHSLNPSTPHESSSSSQSNLGAKISVRKSLQATPVHSSNSSVPGLVEKSSKRSILPTDESSTKPSTVVEEKRGHEKWEGRGTCFKGQDSPDNTAFEQVERSEDMSGESEEPIQPEEHDSVEDSLLMLDSVSPDLSVEFISDPRQRQWQSSHVEQERYDDQQFSDGSYENTYCSGGLIQHSSQKEPPDSGLQVDNVESTASKRRRVENMWEPDDSTS